MNAYELFSRDLMGDELSRTKTDRRTYYNALRQTLREELAAGASCELLAHYGKRLTSGSVGHMYLLDAAALWECYESVVGGLRFPRDIGQGLPFPAANGSRLTWSEIQRQSDLRTLPVAELDGELTARIEALVLYAQTPVSKRAALRPAPVNPRARLAMVEARTVAPIPAPGAAEAEAQSKLQEQLAQHQETIARLQAERDALAADVARLEKRPQVNYEEVLQVSEMILQDRIIEAANKARQLNVQLQADLQRLMEADRMVADLQGQVDSATEQLQADVAQERALRTQRETVRQAAEEARRACDQAKADAAEARREKQEAEQQLSQARQELSEYNASLRETQSMLARVAAAGDLTRRQADMTRRQLDQLP